MNAHRWLDVFLVVKEDQSFARSKSGTIWGTIYFQIGDNQFFPGKGWTDMVAAFVAAWLEGLVRVTNGTVANQRVHFFDGPFLRAAEGAGEPQFSAQRGIKAIHDGRSPATASACGLGRASRGRVGTE